jgi:hypothetical protein
LGGGRTIQDGDTGLGDRRRDLDLDLLKIDLADPCNVLKSTDGVEGGQRRRPLTWGWVVLGAVAVSGLVHPISMRLMRW